MREESLPPGADPLFLLKNNADAARVGHKKYR